MRKLSLIAALVVAGALTATTEASLVLPALRSQLTSDAVFDTSFEPRIDVTTGQLVPVDAGPTIDAWGLVLRVSDANDSSNFITPDELTFHFSGQLSTDPGDISQNFSTDGRQVRYTIVSTIRDAELNFYYDPDGTNFNVLSTVGQSTSSSELNDAVDGELYIRATPREDIRSTIEITYFRVSEEANFTNFKITQQYINNEVEFDIVDGSILDIYPRGWIEGINAGQIGPYPPPGDAEFASGRSFATETVNIGGQDVLVNAPVDELIRANSSAVVQVIPEPASAMLLGLGGLVLLARRRAMA